MDQAAFAEPDNKIQKVKQAKESRSAKLSDKNQENEGLNLASPLILVVSNKSALKKSTTLRKKMVKPKLIKGNLVTKS
jgi:hypothetical protein